MARDDYFVIVYSLLKYLYDCLKSGKKVDTDELTAEKYGIPNSYWEYILRTLKDEGFTQGYKFLDTKFGRVHTDLTQIEITAKGISYLFENSLFEKAKKTLKEIKEMNIFT